MVILSDSQQPITIARLLINHHAAQKQLRINDVNL